MSKGGKLRKMVRNYKNVEKEMEKEDEEMKKIWKEAQKTLKAQEEHEDKIVHGFFVYECQDCGTVYKMWLEKGLEDSVHDKECPDQHKPVPFSIRCKCGSFNCFHILWGYGEKENYELLKRGESYFANDPKFECGKPKLGKSYRSKRAFYVAQVADSCIIEG